METVAKKKSLSRKTKEKLDSSSSLTIKKSGKNYSVESVSAKEIMKRRNPAYKFLA